MRKTRSSSNGFFHWLLFLVSKFSNFIRVEQLIIIMVALCLFLYIPMLPCITTTAIGTIVKDEQQLVAPAQENKNAVMTTLTSIRNASSTSDNTTTTTTTTTVYWCAITRTSSQPEGKSFHHFAHAMIPLSLCWSYFVQHNATTNTNTNNNNNKCGFIWDSFVTQKILHRANTDWILTFLEATGCHLQLQEAPPPAEGEGGHLFQHVYTPDNIPRSDELTQAHDWLTHPEHGVLLRNVILQHRGVALPPPPKKTDTTIRIGFLNRHDTRRVLNLEQVMLEVTKQFIKLNIVVDMTWFTSSIPWEEQIRWFASHDIIVGPHGAAMTNCLFLEPYTTTVIELFPKNYFPYQFFGSLVEQVGGRHVAYYSNHGLTHNKGAALNDFRATITNITARQYWRNFNFNVTVDDVVHLLKRDIGRRREQQQAEMTEEELLSNFYGTVKSYKARLKRFMNQSHVVDTINHN
mmetsp:Transcript_21323/g.32358  ORF Transcript_21323/g.32358 Transcript_21323/m.32358 type:complete len:462 (+) Transcript_21323:199-1584(+)|eukprot:CAMPEP_0194239084 /NCGR_PEP_ID=MMETSP0158-20130606/5657_1 /TAXON_ID=33649 /ORGANISM="Thalassionema nitzschioides, Strain L26-B" /LENGTH=461 /DNA_ID=CAMNT_0038973483 /DNA_START=187 /DNA_END=1572 /DNA_ORIENTATION=+